MANSKPFVQAACVCERFLQEKDDVLSVIRMVDVLTLKTVQLPTQPGQPNDQAKQSREMIQVMDLNVVVSLKSADLKGDFRIAVVMRDPDEKSIQLLESPVTFKGDDGVNLMIRFGLPHNAPEGRYWFDVVWDGELLTQIPLKLRKEAGQTASVRPN